MTEPQKRPAPTMHWGSLPDLIGPRHLYRVHRLASWLEAALPSGYILDAGCGAGRLTELLARHEYRVLALDGSPEFVAYVQRRAETGGLSQRIEARVADLEDPGLPAGTFDGVVSGEVLEHLRDDAAAVRALATALRPGGVLVLSVPAGASQYDWLDRWAGHERRYDEPSLRQLLTDAGLEVERLVRWGFPFMTLYERYVQRPGLAHAGVQGDEQSWLARLARSNALTAAFGLLFRIDEWFEGSGRGTGFLVRARKPRRPS